MADDLRLLNQIIQHRLGQGDIDRILTQVSSADREDLISKIGDLLHRMSSLMDIYQELSGSPSLDHVLARLIEIITEALTADRGTLFLYDDETGELFSRVVQGDGISEIRFPAHSGIAGHVFTTGKAVLIDDAYADSRFNPEIDRQTGYRTRTILCVPLRNRDGEIIGASQLLNKQQGTFSEDDRNLLGAITTQAAAALENAQLYERIRRARHEEAQLMEISNALSSELHLDRLLEKIMASITEMLDAERSTLFIHDLSSRELWSLVVGGDDMIEIRIPENAGIAGSTFCSGKIINIPDAYADPRFNQEIDRKTGFRTRNILCMPVVNKEGTRIGVTQVLNKRGGPFNRIDEHRLQALTSQAAVALENARLFDDVVNARNYSEAILASLNDGVITLDRDRNLIKANAAATRILGLEPETIMHKSADAVFGSDNQWLLDSIGRVESERQPDVTLDTDYVTSEGRSIALNMNVVPLVNNKEEAIGCMLIFGDLTREKRMRTTMARYMTKEVADRLLEEDSMLGGTAQNVTVLFSDIRGFTGIAEHIGARETVSMLNDYFTIMVEIIFSHDGILDKYIGDAIMALYGAPFTSEQDADRALATANDMMRALDHFNRERQALGIPTIDIGIGINSDEVIAGNIGSPKRMDYTVIGDGVNLAARLESANKLYGSRILISEQTRGRLTQTEQLRELDLIRVKGKQQPVAIFESLDYLDTADIESLIGEFSTGIDAYRQMDWHRARQCFETTLKIRPDDRPSQLYLQRCQFYLQQPPAADWDRVWVMQDK